MEAVNSEQSGWQQSVIYGGWKKGKEKAQVGE